MVQGGLAKGVAVWLVVLAASLVPAGAASGSIWFGATISGETYGEATDAPLNSKVWDQFERHAGKRVAILLQGQNWGSFNQAPLDATVARGAVPLLTMGLAEGMTLHDVVDGSQDATIRSWARAAKAWGHPFLFAPWWEMNGTWYAWGRSPEYVAAWRHFHDLVEEEGATNVTWAWVVNSKWSDPESDPTPYYPGDAYVDWTGLDSYNWGLNPAQPDRWYTPSQVLSPTLKIIDEVAPTKPVAIVEDASSELGGNKADWIREMLTTYLPHHPQVKAYLWFNWNFPKNGFRADWPIESSTPAQQQFRQSIQSSLYVPGPVSLPALTKVPPPADALGGAGAAGDLSGVAEMPGGPDVAVAPDGTATVVWSARSGGEFGVFARRIAPDGVPEPTTVRLSAAGQDALAPQVALAPDGTATVTWIRSDGSYFLVQARRIAPDGTPDESTKNMSTTGQDAASPEVAVGADGTSTVVWKRYDGAHYVVQERRIDPEGNREETAHQLSASGKDAVEPQVAAAPGGTATVVWSRYDGSHSVVQERQVGADGSPAEATLDLSDSSQNAVQPRVGVTSGGDALMLWDRFDGSEWIVQERGVSAAGIAEAAARDLSAPGGSAAEPALAVGGDGSATAVWERFDDSRFVVQARRILASGALGPGPLDVSSGGGDASEPALAIGPAGGTAVLWSEVEGSEPRVRRRDLGADETLGATEAISAVGQQAGAPALAWGSDETLVSAWRRTSGGGDAVEYRASPKVPPPPPSEPGPSGGESSGSGSPGNGGSGSTGSKSNPPASTTFRLGRPRLNRRTGTATVPVIVPGPGMVSLAGPVPRQLQAEGAETLKLLVVPRPAQRRLLRRRHRLRLEVTITYNPLAGNAGSRRLVLQLRRRPEHR